MKLEIIQRETVKPSSPTPKKCGRYELSFLDQLCSNRLVPVLLFYPSTTFLKSISETSQLLIKSLSQTLTRFYHFAGRLQDNVSITCNDDGAEFVAAKFNCPMSRILANPSLDTLKEFVPNCVEDCSPLLLVQANFFDCGGLAICACLSHKAGDASTLSMFLNSWASATSRSELEQTLVPQFVSSASMFPPLESLAYFVEPYKVPDANEKIKSKRLVFRRTRIEALRQKVAATASITRDPTRVEAVSALIWKCVIEASSVSEQSKSDKSGSCFIQVVNIRRRMNPCLPENTVGNLLWFFKTKWWSSSEVGKIELKDLVVLLRKGVDEVKAIWNEGIPPIVQNDYVVDGSLFDFAASSWCRFPLYSVDFGWGKPAWVCNPSISRAKNTCVMMDTRDGEGIEVWLGLAEEEMEHFETNPDLLAFASVDPAVIYDT